MKTKPKNISDVLSNDILDFYTLSFKKLKKIYENSSRNLLSFERAIREISQSPKGTFSLPEIIAIGQNMCHGYFRNDGRAILKHEAMRNLLQGTYPRRKSTGMNKEFHLDFLIYALSNELESRGIRTRYKLIYDYIKDVIGHDLGSIESVRMRNNRLNNEQVAESLKNAFLIDTTLLDDFEKMQGKYLDLPKRT